MDDEDCRKGGHTAGSERVPEGAFMILLPEGRQLLWTIGYPERRATGGGGSYRRLCNTQLRRHRTGSSLWPAAGLRRQQIVLWIRRNSERGPTGQAASGGCMDAGKRCHRLWPTGQGKLPREIIFVYDCADSGSTERAANRGKVEL